MPNDPQALIAAFRAESLRVYGHGYAALLLVSYGHGWYYIHKPVRNVTVGDDLNYWRTPWGPFECWRASRLIAETAKLREMTPVRYGEKR